MKKHLVEIDLPDDFPVSESNISPMNIALMRHGEWEFPAWRLLDPAPEAVAYACSDPDKLNHVISVAQYKNALPKNVMKYDMPLYAHPPIKEAMGWRDIESAPKDVRVLLYWRPITSNPYAEAVVCGTVPSAEPGKWWSDNAVYQDLWHITHWMPLPPPPIYSIQSVTAEAMYDEGK